MQYIQNYFLELFELTNEMSPYLLLGFFFAGILHVFFKKEQIAKYMGGSKIKSAIYAALIGIPLPLCSCGVIPTGVSFYKNGASKGSTVSFLISTPQTGVDSVLVTYSLLGLPFAIIRPIIALISGVFGGVFTNWYTRFDEPQIQTELSQANNLKSKENIFSKFFNYAFVEFLQDISKWLIIGLMIAAFIALVLPNDFFTTYVNNPFLSMGIVLLASIPLYVCATGSVPIAAVLLMKGLSPGAALVFLMAGPATNSATITVLAKVMGKKALSGYLLSIIGFSLLFGFFIDYFFPREWFTSFISMGHTNHSEHGFPYWFQSISTIILISLIINGYFQKYRAGLFHKKAKSKTSDKAFYTYFRVEGMTCNHCKANAENGLNAIKGIEVETIDLKNSTIKIKGTDIDYNLVKKTVESLGFSYKGQVLNNLKIKTMETYKVYVKGMTCNHCKANVENAIKKISGIISVDANISNSIVNIEGVNIKPNEIKKCVEGVGYEYGGIIN
ncbi:MAG: hypothetical protein B6I20_06570 [Bacteroidetes bacterium 4572_117]|nr:MAG: hypothetical protein B6I20_06570 [Bacteroidetes bacterium 4572_117]